MSNLNTPDHIVPNIFLEEYGILKAPIQAKGIRDLIDRSEYSFSEAVRNRHRSYLRSVYSIGRMALRSKFSKPSNTTAYEMAFLIKDSNIRNGSKVIGMSSILDREIFDTSGTKFVREVDFSCPGNTDSLTKMSITKAVYEAANSVHRDTLPTGYDPDTPIPRTIIATTRIDGDTASNSFRVILPYAQTIPKRVFEDGRNIDSDILERHRPVLLSDVPVVFKLPK